MEEKQQVISRFVKDETEMVSACFDEYFFVIPEGVIKPFPRNAAVYCIGDVLPVSGETYKFPDDFNIIDLHFKIVAKVRGKRLFDVMRIDKYKYDSMPAVNMMGFGIKITTDEELCEFKEHFKTFSLNDREKLAAFANRWFDIVRYRRVCYM